MPNTCLRLAAAAVACAATCVAAVSAGSRIVVAAHRRNYAADASARLQHGRGGDYRFARFQSSAAVKRAFDKCRPRSAFKAHDSDDGRSGAVCTTKLGGDWVLAESEQVAPDCTCEEVLRAYLDGRLQKTWSADKVIDVTTTPKRQRRGERASYRQDLVLHSQRIIASATGVMRYSQRITVDKVGRNYNAHVELDPDVAATLKKPFNTLGVYVGLQQEGTGVRIYAAGVFEVNRKVVPNLVVFDASGIAGDMAGKGTLWLHGEFEKRRRARTG
jgi:hypothetical protein